MTEEARAFVWVNTADGWVAHGRSRALSTALRVAKRLRALDGWDTAAGPDSPPACPAPVNAPSPRIAAHSPAPLATWPRRRTSRATQKSLLECRPPSVTVYHDVSALRLQLPVQSEQTGLGVKVERALRDFYDVHGLSAERFACKHAPSCSAVCHRFVGACEAFIGSAYGVGVVPRLVFVSADPARDLSAGHPPDRAMPAVRAREESLPRPVTGSTDFRKQAHWYKTFQFAYRFFEAVTASAGLPPIPFAEVNRYFAHTNSAKCKDLEMGTPQGKRRLFRNCSEFIPGEVGALRPQLLVTQGTWAARAIERGAKILKRVTYESHQQYHCNVITIDSTPMLWIGINHPNARFRAYQDEVKDAWEWYLGQAVAYMRLIGAPPFSAAN